MSEMGDDFREHRKHLQRVKRERRDRYVRQLREIVAKDPTVRMSSIAGDGGVEVTVGRRSVHYWLSTGTARRHHGVRDEYRYGINPKELVEWLRSAKP